MQSLINDITKLIKKKNKKFLWCNIVLLIIILFVYTYISRLKKINWKCKCIKNIYTCDWRFINNSTSEQFLEIFVTVDIGRQWNPLKQCLNKIDYFFNFKTYILFFLFQLILKFSFLYFFIIFNEPFQINNSSIELLCQG